MTKFSFTSIATSYNRINTMLSLGLHRRWKKKLVKQIQKLGRPQRLIVDIATGTGDICFLLHKAYKKKLFDPTIIGIDPCYPMLKIAQQKATTNQNTEIQWIFGDTEALPLQEGTVDTIVCSLAIRNFSHRQTAFQEWFRVLAPTGHLAILEIFPIPNSLITWPLRVYWRYLVPYLGKLAGFPSAYQYLSDSANNFVGQQQLAKEISEIGFQNVYRRSMVPGGLVSMLIFRKRPQTNTPPIESIDFIHDP